jgi:hypothetical protein
MKKKVGLWIDHRQAVVVFVTNAGEEIKKIESDMEKHVRFTNGDGSQMGSSEDVRDRKFENQLNAYYDRVIDMIRDSDSIQIFGPGEAKGELEKRLKRQGLAEHIRLVSTVDKMTDHQISAKVWESLAA